MTNISDIVQYNQYLNCQNLHGGRFCSLDQTHSEYEKHLSGNYVILYPKSSEDQNKKGLHRKLKRFCPRNQVKTKKKVFSAIWDCIRPEFIGFIRANQPFFL